MSKTVLVTGASGFIGKVIVKELLDNGYVVRGSVRSDAKAEETRKAVGESDESKLSFVKLDLNSDDGWADALQGVDALLHTASPFPIASPKDPEELIRPAVDGTLRALRAAKAAGVERVVVTSSVAAIYNDDLRSDQKVLDHTNWSPTGSSATSAYEDSKTLAEQAAWQFVEDEAPKIELSTINPGVVWGTPLDRSYGSSLELVERLLKGQDPALPDLSFPIVDVADVAKMHRLALERPEAVGERLPAAAGALTMIASAKLLNKHIESSKAKTRKAPDFMVKLMAIFDSDMKSIKNRLGVSGEVSSANSQDKLGMQFISPQDALLASAKFIESTSA